jgi:hypothetical protein
MMLPLLFGFMHVISMWTGVLLMAVALGIIMLFNLVTLPVEFDASRRAKAILNGMGFIRDGQEADGVKKTLDAAGWTYVAAFIHVAGLFSSTTFSPAADRSRRRSLRQHSGPWWLGLSASSAISMDSDAAADPPGPSRPFRGQQVSIPIGRNVILAT